ncbi:hypothetical protein BJ165DRAFT_1535029 [Panaeolus papilionaceus]|nr:hypothetical protein BJ165DRAFT_1535029 [Panaeolus papilionaceus]
MGSDGYQALKNRVGTKEEAIGSIWSHEARSMGLTPLGTCTSRPSAAFHGRLLALGVVDKPRNVLVGSRWSFWRGGATTDMVDHLDAIDVGFGVEKRTERGLMDVENKEDDVGLKVGYERGVGSRSDGRSSEIFVSKTPSSSLSLIPPISD